MKTRFRAIFAPASIRSASWMACLLTAVVLAGGTLVSCQAGTGSTASSPSPVVNQDEEQWHAFDRIYTLFGQKQDKVWKVLFPDGSPQFEKREATASSSYWINESIPLNNIDTTIQLGFHHDILMSVLYRFDRPEDAITTSRALIDHLDNFAGLTHSMTESPNRLASLTEVPDAAEFPKEYFEEWEITLPSDIVAVLLPDEKVAEHAFQLRLSLSFPGASTATIQVRYVEVRDNYPRY